MSDIDAARHRRREIEELSESRPGAALDQLEEFTAELDDVLAGPLAEAHRLIRNEDFTGAARVLGDGAVLLQQTATLSLAIREHIRRRR